MSDPWAQAAADFDEENSYREKEFAELTEHGRAWREKWPNHCKSCGGWGGTTGYESHGLPGGLAEPIGDGCDALPETQCHRCGEHGLTEDMEGPCRNCGWNFDDGDTTP